MHLRGSGGAGFVPLRFEFGTKRTHIYPLQIVPNKVPSVRPIRLCETPGDGQAHIVFFIT